MKMMKKLATMLLAVCLVVPVFSMLTHAAGQIQFTDPSAKVGETVEVTVALKAGITLGDVKVVVKYDTDMLKFESGSGVTESEGKLTYSGKGSDSTLRYTMKFQALKEGTTKLTVSDSTIKSSSGTIIQCTKGTSTIKIAAGSDTTNPSEVGTAQEIAVDINGESYVFTGNFAQKDIPKGYVEATLNYDDVDCRVVQHETSGLYLGYLLDEDKIGQFFLYNSEDATFSPFVQIEISDTTSIVLLSNVEGIVLPENYQKTEISVNNQDFPAWRDKDKLGYAIIYATNNQGETSLYQLDSTEGTYQRFEMPEIEEKETSFIGKLSAFLQGHLDYVILMVGLGLVFFIVLVIVLSVKLYNRNAELDDLYEEYGIDYERDDAHAKNMDDYDEDLDDDDDFKFEIDPRFYDDNFGKAVEGEETEHVKSSNTDFEIDFIDLDD